ncbi:MAG: YcxB family protein [Verrucomicrobiota bacterium]
MVLLTSLFSFKAFLTVLPFGIMALFFILAGPFQTFLLKRQIQRMKILNEEICWSFSTTGTEQVTKEAKSQETWKVYHQAVRTKKGILLYPQEKLAYWIPFTAFNSAAEIEAVDELIGTQIKTYRRA